MRPVAGNGDTSDPGPPWLAADAEQTSGSELAVTDASELSPTRVTAHITVRDDPRQATIERIRGAMAQARTAGQPLIASTARHWVGGQRLARDGTVVTLDQTWLEADTTRRVYRVAASARTGAWSGSMAPRLRTMSKRPLRAWAMYMFMRT